MKHRPRYSETTQRLINACQAVRELPTVEIRVPLESANDLARVLPSAEIALFDFTKNQDQTFTVSLKP